MNHSPSPPDGIRREESRYLDGELSEDAARRLEERLAADPVRAARLDAWTEAMDLWREDAARAARGFVGLASLTDTVLAAGDRDTTAAPERRTPTGAGWYAAAAALLIAVGTAGTLFARHRTDQALSRPAHLVGIEDTVMDLMINSPDFTPRLADAKEGR